MPRYDVECTVCGHEAEVVAHWSDKWVPCRATLADGTVCGAETERVWKGKAPAVIDDQLIGGAKFIENLDVKPVWCESKTQLKREAKARGLVQVDRHACLPGTDKAKYTTKWF